VPAVIIPVRDANGALVDLVAWSNLRCLVASWLGNVAFLGTATVFRLDPYGAQTVHPSPLEWLRDARQGLVIVDEQKARFDLCDFGPFSVSDFDFAQHLDAVLTSLGPTIILLTD
jgi:hypothetical protein